MGGMLSWMALVNNLFPSGKLKGIYLTDGMCQLLSIFNNTAASNTITTAFSIVHATITAASVIGETNITLSTSYPTGTKLLIGALRAVDQEIVTVTGSPTGAGPYTTPVTACVFAHPINTLVSDYPSKTITAAGQHDPYLRPLGNFLPIRYRLMSSTADTAVVHSYNAAAMATKLNGINAKELEVVMHSGPHVSGDAYWPGDLMNFLRRCASDA